jgi:acetyltransferase-like isoleucine patch superfamily enzyme
MHSGRRGDRAVRERTTARTQRGIQKAETVRLLGDCELGLDVHIHDFVTIYPSVHVGARTEIFEGAVIGRPPKGAKAVARKIPERLGPTIIGPDCVISAHAILYADVRVGSGTLVGDGASIREGARIGKNCIIARYVTINYSSRVGDNTKIMDGTHITGNMVVGANVFIGTLVGSTNDNLMGAQGYSRRRNQGPVIEPGARIGSGAMLLPGVRIGRGAVIGAGSVVTRDIPPGVMALGTPARVVRKAA